ncbi:MULTISPECIES: hypothetical protein [Legionella]|uniref:Uncharacterized protein n=1 Tax=Legionella drozanskii LLAP-1 TaxID=1212489 RepID=A0A0W0SN35_9GAMM|nr:MULTISPECIES: hypothetical protein [Legionella]KTC84700.1 hypothetical protein Ldro_2864 [Legionella drozanskii LLAP-1]PJE07538.1 MAG: hypothetical protein CK430_13665 [Legionella sp.]
MSLPSKALYISQLQYLEGQVVTPSGHEVKKVRLFDADGQEQIAYFKPIADDYPPLLAKYSVAASVALRLSLGDKAAEDRLVFDETGKKILGTVSFELPGYKPLLSAGKNLPTDPKERELVCPSKETLIKYNVAELLVAAWRYKCDDRHPDNFSLFGLLDWDMILYHITHIMKGGRYIDGILKPIPKKGMRLKAEELDTFPNVLNRTHWPANTIPGNFNYYKHYQAAEAFQALAGSIEFQEQMFEALLKELLSFDPEMLRVRLKEYLGDLPLDYSSLSSKLDYEREYPLLFNSETDNKSFVDHMVRVFQNEYDEFRSEVVYYQGCEENEYGIPVSGFAKFLRNKPSAYKKIQEWAANQNQKMEARAQKIKIHEDLKPQSSQPILNAYDVAPEGRYDLERMKKNYHKFWRDSHVPILSSVIEEAKILANNLANELRMVPIPMPKKARLEGEDQEITKAWMLLGEPEEINESQQIDCHPEHNLLRALIRFEHFFGQFHILFTDYKNLDQEDLTVEKNNIFLEEMIKLVQNCEKEIDSILGNKELNVWSGQLTKFFEDLQCIYGGLNFQRHLSLEKDQSLNAEALHDYPALLKRKHTEEEVVISCLTALFNWTSKLPEGQFDKYVKEIIEQDYEPSFYNVTANRGRKNPVLDFLEESVKENGADRLATILSVSGLKSNSLNTQLIAHLIPKMLADTEQIDVNLLSVRTAFNKDEFDSLFYVQKAREFVLNDERFAHIYAKRNIFLLQDYMYEWVAKLSKSEFQELVLKTVSAYEGPWWRNILTNRIRGETVRGYFDEAKNPGLSNERILAFIFAEGEMTSTSLNPLLFKTILDAMKKDIKKKRDEEKESTDKGDLRSQEVGKELNKKTMIELKQNLVLQAEISEASLCPLLRSLEPYAKEKSYTLPALKKGEGEIDLDFVFITNSETEQPVL